MRSDGLVIRLAVPMFAVGFSGQVVGLAARIAASYQAVEMGLSPFGVLVLSSTFSFVPIFLAVALGRYTDRNGSGPVVMAGSLLMTLGLLLPLLVKGSIAALIMAMATIGVGQTLQIAALQSEISFVPRVRQRDRMIGSFMVYQSLGQIAGPLLLSAVDVAMPAPVSRSLLLSALVIAIAQIAASLPILRAARRPTLRVSTMPISGILATPGLIWLSVAGSLCVAAQDVIYVYTPVVGSEQGISPSGVGFALGAFAVTQMLARVVYSRLANRYGRIRLMKVGLLTTSASIAGISVIGGLASLTATLLCAGLALGLAVTSSVSLSMQHAPAAARATSLSLRLAINRTAQFSVPLAAGVLTPWMGAGAVFIVLSGLIGASLTTVPVVLDGPKKIRSEK